eukprot:TRINITY_DN10830_c0_g1_i1.p1 TRINITY_DN10830_c0_g1~~TRINITY_DN10830_c0_g1_i1.p1  ORF type:complete len:408 (-),score=60.23 TRINITY_DN10830_c0_g1_i1:44-1267(-)
MRTCRIEWSDPGAERALLWLAIDDLKGNSKRRLPQAVYALVASFLQFDAPLPNQLYVVGGRNQQDGPLDSVEMFDTWHGCWVPCPPMSVKRAGCGAAELPDRRILCVGGYDADGIVRGLLSSCEVFDPLTQLWSSDIAPLAHARWGHGCATLGGLVYTVGGCSLRPGAPAREPFMATLRSCEVYDPVSNVWSPCADLQMPRAGSRVVALTEHRLAAVGGCDDVFGRAEMLPTVEVYDATTCRWSLLDVQLSAPRTTAAVAALEDRRVLVIGGAPSLSSAEVFHMPDADGVTPEGHSDVLRLPDISEGRMGCQAVAMQLPPPDGRYPLCSQSCVLVVGGENGEEDWEGAQAPVRQFSSVLLYDTKECEWRPEPCFPSMLLPRTAMAVCVGHGRIQSPPDSRAGCKGGC